MKVARARLRRKLKERPLGTPKKSISASIERAATSLVAAGDLSTEQSIQYIDRLASRYGATFIVELLWVLAHLHFDEDEALVHWNKITALQADMSTKLSTPVDVRVALVQYFLETDNVLESPTLIELKLLQDTQASVYRDDLTGLYNYRYLRELLEREFARVERYDSALSLVLFDLDNFKQYNDRLGHEAGNKALAALGHIIASSIRKGDVAARYGGEEFVLVLPATPKAQAYDLANAIRERVGAHFELEGKSIVTVSGGIATHPVDGLKPEALLEAADRAMYLAKSQGKNRVILFGGDRRSYKRVETSIGGSYRVLATDGHPFHCVDISEGGMMVRVDVPLPANSIVDVRVTLPQTMEEIACVARVARSTPKDGKFEVGFVFVSISDHHRDTLVKFIRNQA